MGRLHAKSVVPCRQVGLCSLQIVQFVGVELSMQGAAAHPNFLCGLGAVTVAFLQGADDEGLLGVLHGEVLFAEHVTGSGVGNAG